MVVLETPEENVNVHGMEYTLARERHQQLLEEAETHRLRRQVGRWVARGRVGERRTQVAIWAVEEGLADRTQ